jgi:hypothetical protein
MLTSKKICSFTREELIKYKKEIRETIRKLTNLIINFQGKDKEYILLALNRIEKRILSASLNLSDYFDILSYLKAENMVMAFEKRGSN